MGRLSEDCELGQHDLCDGCNLDSAAGCECPCHDEDFYGGDHND